MTWYYMTYGSDQAPIFIRNPSHTTNLHGPFDSLQSAISDADEALRHDINVFRRSLSALRRGEYAVVER